MNAFREKKDVRKSKKFSYVEHARIGALWLGKDGCEFSKIFFIIPTYKYF